MVTEREIVRPSLHIRQREEASGLFMIDLCFSVNIDCAWVLDTGCASHVCNKLQVLERLKMLAKGEVDLRMGNGAKVSAIAVGEVNLKLASGHNLVLDTYYYVPSIIKNIISVSYLNKLRYNFFI